MMVFFSLILALALLVGIIYILRHHQERTRQDVVAREQPLPPLARETRPPTRTQAPRAEPPAVNPAPSATSPPASASSTDPTPAIAPSVAPSQVTDNATETTDWRQRCQTLRDQGHFHDALITCRQAWPQWQSFDHAARVIRAAIRSEPTDSEGQQQWLRELYVLAAQASFLHDKVSGMPEPTWQLLAQQFDPQQIDGLEMPWSEIGYHELRLLTKSDRKLLVQLLGEPSTHQSARVFHGKQ